MYGVNNGDGVGVGYIIVHLGSSVAEQSRADSTDVFAPRRNKEKGNRKKVKGKN